MDIWIFWGYLFQSESWKDKNLSAPQMHFSLNPLSPNIHIHILQTDLHTSPLGISWENLIKDLAIFSMVITLLILITLSLDNVWILLGENWCWSPFGLKKWQRELESKCIPQVSLGLLLEMHWPAIGQFFPLSLVTVSEVFAKVNSA